MTACEDTACSEMQSIEDSCTLRRVYKSSRNDAVSEHPDLEAHGKKYKTSFYRMLGDVSTCSLLDHLPLQDVCLRHQPC